MTAHVGSWLQLGMVMVMAVAKVCQDWMSQLKYVVGILSALLCKTCGRNQTIYPLWTLVVVEPFGVFIKAGIMQYMMFR